MILRCTKSTLLHVVLSAALLVAAPDGPSSAQEPAAPPVRATEPAKPSEPAATTAPATPAPQAEPAKCLWRGWYLLSLEGRKIGYENQILSRLSGPGPAVYRLEVYRFLKAAAADKRPTTLEKCILEMDGDFTALSFDTTRTDVAGPAVRVQGSVADGKLTVTATVGATASTWTTPAAGKPTFDAAILFALAAQPLVEGRTFSRLTIDERYGLMGATAAMARVMQKVSVSTPAGPQDGFALVEQRGNTITAHLVDAQGRRVRSEGQNHNLAAQTMTDRERQDLNLDGQTPWQNRISEAIGQALSSQAFGYTLSMPAYPYVTSASSGGQIVTADGLTGDEAMHLVVMSLSESSGESLARSRALFATWCRMVGPAAETVEGQTTVDGLPALTVRGKTTLGGRAAEFETTIVVREHLGYVIGRLLIQPSAPGNDTAYRRLIESIRWTKIFGRERGHWDKNVYVSDSHGYRLELLGSGWRLPEERSGVATSVEAVRQDRSGLVAVVIEPAADQAVLETLADQYEKNVKAKVADATDLQRKDTRLGGRAAVLLTYSAKAIDGEPTVSQHVLTLDAGRLVVLTLVTRKSQLEANLAHFAQAMESFQFIAANNGR